MIRVIFSRMRASDSCPPRVPVLKVAWSWLGAFLSMYFVAILSSLTEVDVLKSMFLVGSFGASAVLIYGAPQADFSQPRNLIGGHIISAFIGVLLVIALVINNLSKNPLRHYPKYWF